MRGTGILPILDGLALTDSIINKVHIETWYTNLFCLHSAGVKMGGRFPRFLSRHWILQSSTVHTWVQIVSALEQDVLCLMWTIRFHESLAMVLRCVIIAAHLTFPSHKAWRLYSKHIQSQRLMSAHTLRSDPWWFSALNLSFSSGIGEGPFLVACPALPTLFWMVLEAFHFYDSSAWRFWRWLMIWCTGLDRLHTEFETRRWLFDIECRHGMLRFSQERTSRWFHPEGCPIDVSGCNPRNEPRPDQACRRGNKGLEGRTGIPPASPMPFGFLAWLAFAISLKTSCFSRPTECFECIVLVQLYSKNHTCVILLQACH